MAHPFLGSVPREIDAISTGIGKVGDNGGPVLNVKAREPVVLVITGCGDEAVAMGEACQLSGVSP